eukprot:2253957-Amphidinium_carterae.3
MSAGNVCTLWDRGLSPIQAQCLPRLALQVLGIDVAVLGQQLVRHWKISMIENSTSICPCGVKMVHSMWLLVVDLAYAFKKVVLPIDLRAQSETTTHACPVHKPLSFCMPCLKLGVPNRRDQVALLIVVRLLLAFAAKLAADLPVLEGGVDIARGACNGWNACASCVWKLLHLLSHADIDSSAAHPHTHTRLNQCSGTGVRGTQLEAARADRKCPGHVHEDALQHDGSSATFHSDIGAFQGARLRGCVLMRMREPCKVWIDTS